MKLSKHDKFFKSVFKVEKNLKDFLENYLPEELVKEIDISSIDYLDNTYLDKNLKMKLSDLVVKTKLKNGNDLDLYFLFEHKSYKDKKIFYQLINYMNMMWLEDIRNKRELRNIVPLVFYHGKEKWNLKTNFIENFNVNRSISKYMLNFKYILFDLNDKNPNEDMLNKNVFLLTAMLLMKTIKENNIDKIRQIFTLWRQQGIIKKSDIIFIFMEYIISSSEIDKSKILNLIENEFKEVNEEMPTIAEQIRIEEREKNLKEAEEKFLKEKHNVIINLYNNGVEIKIIAKSVGMSEEEVQKIIDGK